MTPRPRSPRLGVAALVVVVVAALAVGSRGEAGPATPAARADRLAARVRCPTCAGLSAAESEAASSQAVRQEIRARVDAGASDDAILGYLVDRYGEDILLTPPSTGTGSLVWVLPVVALVLAGGALAAAFRRWRAAGAEAATDDDRALVARAREG